MTSRWWRRVCHAARWLQRGYQRYSSLLLVLVVVVGGIFYLRQQSATNGFAQTAASYGKANNTLGHELKAAQHSIYVSGNRHHGATVIENKRILAGEHAIEFLGVALAQQQLTVTNLLNQHSSDFAQQQADFATEQAQAAASAAFLNDLKALAGYLVQAQVNVCAAVPNSNCPPIPTFTPVPTP